MLKIEVFVKWESKVLAMQDFFTSFECFTNVGEK